MSNPFENTKEPRFTGAYIFDNAKDMFTKGADVYTYGIYSNGSGGGGETPWVPVNTGISPNYVTGEFTHCSNIGALTQFSNKRCWAISISSSSNNITIYNVQDNTVAATVFSPTSLLQDFREDVNHLFIFGGKLYLVARDYVSYATTSKLYVLANDLTWTLVADKILHAVDSNAPWSNKPNVHKSGLTTTAWWGLKFTSYTPSTSSGWTNNFTSPRLVKMNSSGVVTEYATATIPNADEHTGFVVTESQITVIYRAVGASYYDVSYISYDISSGTPVLNGSGLISSGWPGSNVWLPCGQMDTHFVRAASTSGNTLTFTRTAYSAGSLASTSYTPVSLSGSRTGSAEPRANVVGWSSPSENSQSALLFEGRLEGYYGFNSVFPDTTLFVKLNGSTSATPYVVNGKTVCAAYDSVSNRVYLLNNYNYGVTQNTKLQYMTIN